MFNERRYESSPDHSTELFFVDGLVDFDVFVGPEGGVPVGVEFDGSLGVDST